jgi:hypothetical protein
LRVAELHLSLSVSVIVRTAIARGFLRAHISRAPGFRGSPFVRPVRKPEPAMCRLFLDLVALVESTFVNAT